MSLAHRSAAALLAVSTERLRQIDLWGVQSHHPDKWNRILGEEVGEVAKALNDHEPVAALRAELSQVAAVAVAWIEDIDAEEAS